MNAEPCEDKLPIVRSVRAEGKSFELVAKHRKSRRVSLALIRHFEAVGRLGSVRQAAIELQITPAAISQQIRKLEVELGGELFFRHIKGMILNEAGLRFFEACQKSLGEIDCAADELTRRT